LTPLSTPTKESRPCDPRSPKAMRKGLGKHLGQDARCQYKAKAWYLAPPLDVPGKELLSLTSEMVLQQKTADADLTTLEPFLRELGWEPPSQ
jgi:hypothetical protein